MKTLKEINEEFDKKIMTMVILDKYKTEVVPETIKDFWNSKIKQVLEQVKPKRLMDGACLYELEENIKTVLEE